MEFDGEESPVCDRHSNLVLGLCEKNTNSTEQLSEASLIIEQTTVHGV